MDQVTQILLGSTAAQATLGSRLGLRAALVGGAAGFAPDLDVLLKPLADPIFPMEVHRTFTHAWVTVPVGALVVGSLFLLMPSYRRLARWVLLAAFVGWLTHPPLDACTSYGTMLLWPFDRSWVAWDLIAIVDPLFTLVLLGGLVLALRRRRAAPAWIALALALAYLGLGATQRDRALDAQVRLAAARGDRVTHARVIPVLGSLLFWRSLYRTADEIRSDHLRLLPGAPATWRAGDAGPVFGVGDLPADLPDRDTVEAVFGRFEAFADGFTTRVPAAPEVVGDVRYALDAGFTPAWGVRVVPGVRPVWVDLAAFRPEDLELLLRTMTGTDGPYRALPSPEGPR